MKKAATKKKKKVLTPRMIQRGKSSKALIIVVVLVVLAGLGGGYLFMQKNGGSVGITIPGMKAPLNANCEYKDPDLCKFINNWGQQGTYSTTTKSSYGGVAMESLMEISDGKSHMKTSMNGKEQSNTISIDDATYTLDYADSKWFKTVYKESKEPTGEMKEIKDDFDINEMKDTTTYKFVTKESCGSMTCFKYEMINSEDSSSKTFIWFDDREYKMRKMTVESKDGNMESVYSYEGVSISTPSPVKEGQPDASTNAPSDEEIQKMMKQYKQSPSSEGDYNTEAPVDDSSEADY